MDTRTVHPSRVQLVFLEVESLKNPLKRLPVGHFRIVVRSYFHTIHSEVPKIIVKSTININRSCLFTSLIPLFLHISTFPIAPLTGGRSLHHHPARCLSRFRPLSSLNDAEPYPPDRTKNFITLGVYRTPKLTDN